MSQDNPFLMSGKLKELALHYVKSEEDALLISERAIQMISSDPSLIESGDVDHRLTMLVHRLALDKLFGPHGECQG